MDGWKPVLSFSYGKAALFIEGQMPDKGLLGALGISSESRQRWYKDVPARHI